MINLMLAKLGKLGESARIKELEKALADAAEVLDEAVEENANWLRLVQAKSDEVAALYRAVVLLNEELKKTNRNGTETIACLLSAAGGSVELSADLVLAVRGSDITVDYTPNEEKNTVTLSLKLTDPQEEGDDESYDAELADGDEDDQDEEPAAAA